MTDSQKIWEEEYGKRRLMSGTAVPKSVQRFAKFLKKQKIDLLQSRVLDLGSGEGKNVVLFAERGARVDGIEIARNAIETAHKSLLGVKPPGDTKFHHGSIGEPYNFEDETFDVNLDVTSSNSLSEPERDVYLTESSRVLKTNGYMFVRALCKDGDSNAKQLIKDHPGPEHDTYIMPGWGQTERVFTEVDLRELYEQYFTIVHLEKETHYTTFDGRKYKRNFWVMYLSKKS